MARARSVDSPAADPVGRIAGGGTGLAWGEARRRAHAAARPGPARRVGLAAAAGLTLAEPLLARNPLPAFDTAAMDGYALGEPGEPGGGAGPYRLDGEVRAGDPAAATRPLRPGTARAISTGAQIPPGTTAVLRLEDAARDGESVRATRPVPAGRHIRRAGEEAPLGAVLAPAGSPVRPALLGLAAAAGHDDLLVRPRPRVRLIITGDELTQSGTSGDGLVRDALGPLLAPLVAQLGGELVGVRHLPDRPAEPLEAALAAAGDEITVVTGSTSVGRGDRLRPLLRRHHATWVVDSVACRPGHPQLLAGLAGGGWVVGLPGNPFAAFVAAHTLLGPLLAGLAGRALPTLPAAAVSGQFRHSPGRTSLVPVSWTDAGAAAGTRVLAGHQPAFLGAAATCDALAVAGPDWRPGDAVALLIVH